MYLSCKCGVQSKRAQIKQILFFYNDYMEESEEKEKRERTKAKQSSELK